MLISIAFYHAIWIGNVSSMAGLSFLFLADFIVIRF
jgi:hypothetical protein